MADLLVRNVPDDTVAALDAKARKQGIARAEYLRRLIESDARRSDPTEPIDWVWFDQAMAGLRDSAALDELWRRHEPPV